MPRPNQGPRLKLKQSRGSKSARYHIVWYEDGQRHERSTGTDDRGQAERQLSAFIAERYQPIVGPVQSHEVTIAEILALYGSGHAPTVRDRARIGYCIDALLPFWGTKAVSSIKSETCRAYANFRKVGDGTIRRELGCLRAAVNYAVREGVLLIAPALTLPPKPPSRERWLSRNEAAQILWASRSTGKAKYHLPIFILIGLYTGARKEAILSLQWQPNTVGGWVDLENSLIDFNPVGRIASNKRRSRIPIPRRLVTFLKYARRRTSQYVIEYECNSVADVKKSFAAACNRAGLTDVTPHTLRHTAATWLVQHGIGLWEVSGYLSMSMQTIERVYGHHAPDYLVGAANAIGQRQPTP
jgi:integrase